MTLIRLYLGVFMPLTDVSSDSVVQFDEVHESEYVHMLRSYTQIK